MATNILALPLAALAIVTGNNEDWIDSVKFVVGDAEGPQLDLRGIEFEMELRRQAIDHEVILNASTEEDPQTIYIGAPPNVGYLLIHITRDEMKTRMAGEYVGDVVAKADGFVRRCLEINLTIVEGVTKWP